MSGLAGSSVGCVRRISFLGVTSIVFGAFEAHRLTDSGSVARRFVAVFAESCDSQCRFLDICLIRAIVLGGCFGVLAPEDVDVGCRGLSARLDALDKLKQLGSMATTSRSRFVSVINDG